MQRNDYGCQSHQLLILRRATQIKVAVMKHSVLAAGMGCALPRCGGAPTVVSGNLGSAHTEGDAVTVRRTLNVHRLNVPASDPKRTTRCSMEMPELTRLMADWRAYIAGGTPTGGVYVFFTEPTEGDDRRVALKFDHATFLEVN